tara:strand:- start:634 stop:1389 length:756 start_codon:yes stop_codon:yes gene_type:complete
MYREILSKRNEQFCKLHDITYISVQNHHEINMAEISNHHYIRFWVIKQAILANKIKDGDIIYHYDADIFIAKLDKCIEPTKSFTYAIDSGNTHIAGLFCMVINDFTRKLIDLYLNLDNINKAQNIMVYDEYTKAERPMWEHDQYMFQHYAGIKRHSWQSHWELPNFGLRSYITPLTVFSLDELKENVEIIPTCWNVTHLVDETGENGKPAIFDINRCEKNEVINRHFAGGQEWRCEDWLKYVKNYDEGIGI